MTVAMNMATLPRLAVIAGPTASGKSALALRLADAAGGVVINADALQVYADLRVLTARPPIADEGRAPHRLYGHVDGSDPHDAARWAVEARSAVADTLAAGRLPILVGGTGLYLRALLDGLAPVPPIDPAVRAAVRRLDADEAWPRLLAEDARAAARLHAADRQRVARALEVVRSTGRSLLDWQGQRTGGLGGSMRVQGVIVQPEAAESARRIERRVDDMVTGGAAAEVAALLDRVDVARDAPVWRAIGAREIARWLSGDATRDEAVAATIAATRAFAKRQRTWFRHQPPADWVRVAGAADPVVDRFMQTLVIDTPPVRLAEAAS